MRIAFLGDVHGCVRHAVTAVRGLDVDLAVQVGDLGAYPSYSELPDEDRAFIDGSPAQGDIFGLLDGSLILESVPILFITGNHDNAGWLDSLHSTEKVVAIDASGIFRHVACGTVLDIDGVRFGFLGGVEEPEWGLDIDLDAAAGLAGVDVLVTHDGPYGLAVWEGRTQGSAKLAGLIGRIQPRLHVHGHYHHRNGPRRYGRTRSYGLAQLVPPVPRNPDQRIAPGSIGILDTATLSFSYGPVGQNPGHDG
ncbi:MAG TPA: metallophosphoesterase, partial [Mycobacteriales bacterium]|nr:metallophosphoesterase [Mycobacteriales bacterium]